MHQQLIDAAARIASKRLELEARLKALGQAHPFKKMEQAPLVAAALFELLDHQDRFNQVAIAAIGETLTRTELLAAKAGCAFASMPAGTMPGRTVIGEVKSG